MSSVKFSECANNEIVVWCDVAVGPVGGAVGRGSGGSAGGGLSARAFEHSAR